MSLEALAGTQRDRLAVIEIDAANVASRPETITEIFDGRLVAAVVRNVFAAPLIASIVRRLEQDESALLPVVRPRVFRGHLHGRPLVAADAQLGDYLDDARLFRAGAAALFGSEPTLDERIAQILHGLAGAHTVSVPTHHDGRKYLPATLRVLHDGGCLPLHYENETFHNPVMNSLRPQLDLATLMSFYIPVALPGAGGELRIYSYDCLNGGDSLIQRLGGDDAARAHFEMLPWKTLRPGVGDMLVFDGGRFYHEVTAVSGRARWTLGGFLAMTRDHRGVYFWS